MAAIRRCAGVAVLSTGSRPVISLLLPLRSAVEPERAPALLPISRNAIF